VNWDLWLLVAAQWLALGVYWWLSGRAHKRAREQRRALDECWQKLARDCRGGFTAGYIAGLGDGLRRELTTEYPAWREGDVETVKGGAA